MENNPDKNIDDLRKILFQTLDNLADKDNPMDIERAKAISDVAQTMINAAKVEVDMTKVTGARPTTGFIPAPSPAKLPAPNQSDNKARR